MAFLRISQGGSARPDGKGAHRGQIDLNHTTLTSPGQLCRSLMVPCPQLARAMGLGLGRLLRRPFANPNNEQTTGWAAKTPRYGRAAETPPWLIRAPRGPPPSRGPPFHRCPAAPDPPSSGSPHPLPILFHPLFHLLLFIIFWDLIIHPKIILIIQSSPSLK